MTRQFLPKQIEPRKLAQQKMMLSGELPLAEMLRLTDSMPTTEGHIHVELQFYPDLSDNRPVIEGQLRGPIPLICQRCAKPYEHHLDVTFMLTPVSHDSETSTLPNHLEPVVVTDERLLLVDLVEDEILLSLPLVPKHLAEDCTLSFEEAVDKPLKNKSNPFEILKNIKKS